MVFFLHIPLVKQVGIMLHHLSEAKEGNKRQHTSEGTMGKNRAAFSDVPCKSTPPSNRESVNCAVRIKCATCQNGRCLENVALLPRERQFAISSYEQQFVHRGC